MMDEKDRPVKISAFVKASLGLLLTAIVDFLVSFSTAYWATWSAPHIQKHGGYGLWKLWRCQLDPGVTDVMVSKGFGVSDDVMKEKMGCEIKMADSTFPAWYVAAEVLQTLGLAALVTSIVLLFVFMFVPKWKAHQCFMKLIITLSYLAGIFMTVSLLVFGLKVAEEIGEEIGAKDWALSWSFSLSCTACLLIQIAASVLVTESKRLAAADQPHRPLDADYDILPVHSQHTEYINGEAYIQDPEYFHDPEYIHDPLGEYDNVADNSSGDRLVLSPHAYNYGPDPQHVEDTLTRIVTG